MLVSSIMRVLVDGAGALEEAMDNLFLQVQMFFYKKLNIIEGEAMTIKEAMSETIQRGFTQVIFESDSKVVVDAILSRNVGVSEFCSIIS
ncbi:hypothetical protein A2U01_0042888, partial [Trifolium medium]|nr:hypothetical protein [Trifolium medium]